MAGPDTDIVRVKDRAHVVRMAALNIEGHDAAVLRRIVRSVDRDMRVLLHFLKEKRRQSKLLLLNVVEADLADIVDRGPESDSARRVDRPGLEFVRKLRVCRGIARHILDHLSACEERRHLIEQLLFSIENANSHRRKQLMPGKCKEISAELFHIDRHVRRALRAVDDDNRAERMRPVSDLPDRIFRSEHIGDLSDRNDLRLLRDLDRQALRPLRARPSATAGYCCDAP